MSQANDVLPWIAAVVLGGAGLFVIYVAAFRDRATRGGMTRRRCPGCWYDIDGAFRGTPDEPAVCPECGRIIKTERDLQRTRRHARLFAVGTLLFVLAVGATQTPKVRRHGLVSILPTTALLIAPMDAQAWFLSSRAMRDGTAANELAWRILYDQTWNWQERILLDRILDDARRDGATLDSAPPTDGGGLFAAYDVADLAPDDELQDQIKWLVWGQVDPDVWRSFGGNQGVLGSLTRHLVARAPRDTHEQLAALLEDLRHPRQPIAGAEPDDSSDVERRIYALPRGFLRPETMHGLIGDIQTVETRHWRDWGGAIGSVSPYRDVIVIVTHRRNFASIESILVRAASDPRGAHDDP